MGGTCVIRGCVPKKLMVFACDYPDEFRDAARLWLGRAARAASTGRRSATRLHAELDRLEGVYRSNLLKAGRRRSTTPRATLTDAAHGRLPTGETVTAEAYPGRHGRAPGVPRQVEGCELGIICDDMFHLETLPKRC